MVKYIYFNIEENNNSCKMVIVTYLRTMFYFKSVMFCNLHYFETLFCFKGWFAFFTKDKFKKLV